MSSLDLPIPLARVAMRFMPPFMLQRAIDVLIQKMMRRHPRLFKNLKRLPDATVLIEPVDVPHLFLMRFGGCEASLRIVDHAPSKISATIKGSLKTLFDMLEGKEDGDTLFFSRDLIVAGDSSVIVGLRNTLDREEIHLFDEVTSLCGPFSEVAEKTIIHAHTALEAIKAHVDAFHRHLHDQEDKRHDNAPLS